jgi:hypothetical protein
LIELKLANTINEHDINTKYIIIVVTKEEKNKQTNKLVLVYLERGPSEVEKGSDPEKGIVGNHDVGASIAELLHVLLRVECQVHHEAHREDYQSGVVPHRVAIGAV